MKLPGRELKRVAAVVIHHSAVRDGKSLDWVAIERFHTSWRRGSRIITPAEARRLLEQGHGSRLTPPWDAIAYHGGIERAFGKYVVLQGRPVSRSGAHAAPQNYRTLGFLFVGDYDERRPTPEMIRAAVRGWIGPVLEQFNLAPDKLIPHSAIAPHKTCPGRQFPMEELRQVAREYLLRKADQ